MGIPDPVPGKVTGHDGAFHPEDLHPQHLLRHRDDTCLHDAPLMDTVHPRDIRIQIEDLALLQHGLPAAGHRAPGFGVDALHNEVDLRPQHVPQDLVLPQHQLRILLPGGAAPHVDHHLFQGDDNPEPLIVHDGDGLAVVRLLYAAKLPGQDSSGAVGIVNLMPDHVLPSLLRLHFSTGLQCQHGCFCPFPTSGTAGRRACRAFS